ncbi:MAG: hypothetical protein IJE25_01100 [Clostridia bacterium]|nr:hypothetical protein [Clostridia bacterium]
MAVNSSSSKKEVKAYVAELYREVADNKKKVNGELSLYKMAAKNVAGAAKYFASAKNAFDKKPGKKNTEKYEDAKADFLECAATYNSIGECINKLVGEVRDLYNEIAAALPDDKSVKYVSECDRYIIEIDERVNKIQLITDGITLPAVEEEVEVAAEAPAEEVVAEAPAEEAPVVEEAPEIKEEEEVTVVNEAVAEKVYCYNCGKEIDADSAFCCYCGADQSAAPAPVAEEPAADVAPRIMPVSVDVSAIVEKAIAATMQKFVLAFDKRIEKFLSEHPVNIPAGYAPASQAPAAEPAVPTLVSRTYGADEIMALESSILDDEKFLIEKLTAMMDNLKALTASMAELTATYTELSDKQSSINDLQKQTNDLQRHTVREQQGIQVNQRVIAQDQVAIAEEQTMLIEQQKSAQERQQGLTEAQAAMEESQRVVIETQSTLEEAMKSVMQAQKDIIATQQSIIAGNNKNVDLQAELAARQAEVLGMQKEALASQKQVLRDQKSTLEKQKDVEAATPRKKARKKAEAEVAEAPAAEAENVAELSAEE